MRQKGKDKKETENERSSSIMLCQHTEDDEAFERGGSLFPVWYKVVKSRVGINVQTWMDVKSADLDFPAPVLGDMF